MFKSLKLLIDLMFRPVKLTHNQALFDKLDSGLKNKKYSTMNLDAFIYIELKQLENELNRSFGTRGKVKGVVNSEVKYVNPIYFSEWFNTLEHLTESYKPEVNLNFEFGHTSLSELVELEYSIKEVKFKLSNSHGKFLKANEFVNKVKEVISQRVGIT